MDKDELRRFIIWMLETTGAGDAYPFEEWPETADYLVREYLAQVRPEAVTDKPT